MTIKNSTERLIDLSEAEVKKLIKSKLNNKNSNLPYGFWRCAQGKEHSRIAIKYLIEDHLQLSLDEVPKKINAKIFHDIGLFRLLVEHFDSSYFKALEFTYPGKFKPWQFSKGMTGIWCGDAGKKRSHDAINYIINELDITKEKIPEELNYGTFKKFGLGGMLQTLYNSSPFLAIDSLYPNEFKPWEFHVKNFWVDKSIETAREATKWLVDEKLKLSANELNTIRRKHFLQYSLGQMLKKFYRNSHLVALYDSYPDLFKDKYSF